jgi:peroxiredoxin
MKILTIILGVLLFCSCREEIQTPFLTGMESKPLVDFDILLPDSTTYFNTSRLIAGKKIVLFYYSPTCPYCRAQMREMLNHIDRYQNVQLCVITGGDFKAMKEFGNYFKLQKFPNIITGVDAGAVFAKNYKIVSVPFTATFDAEKRLKSAYLGRMSGKALLRITHP